MATTVAVCCGKHRTAIINNLCRTTTTTSHGRDGGRGVMLTSRHRLLTTSTQWLAGTPHHEGTFDRELYRRRSEASNSVLIHHEGNTSESDLLSVCRQYGDVRNYFSYSNPGVYSVVEYETRGQLDRLLTAVKFPPENNGKPIPLQSRLLDFGGKTPRVGGKRVKQKHTQPQILQVICHDQLMAEICRDASTVDQQMEILVQRHHLQDNNIRLRYLVCSLVEEAVARILPNSLQLKPFGSTVNLLGRRDADLDISLDFISRQQTQDEAVNLFFKVNKHSSERALIQGPSTVTMLRCFGGLRRSQGPAPCIWCRHKGTDRSAGPTAPLPGLRGSSTPASIFGDPKPGSSGSRLITDPPLTRPAWTTDQGTGRRSYFSKFASVGKILQGSRSEEDERVLQKWKEKKIRELGQDGFERYKQELFGRGHTLHDSINTYLTQSPPTDPPPVPTGVEGLWASVEHVLGNIMNVKSSECAVEHKSLGYSGVADCVAEYKGKLYLIDWKTSERRKRSLCDCYDQPVQIAAYIGAVNNDYNLPFSVERGLLVICYDTGMKADVHQLDSEILLHYWSMWQQRLHTYNISQQQ